MKKILAKSISYAPGKRDRNNVKYIVIHYTAGNGDTAENEGKFFKNGNIQKAGAHFFVGQNGTVVKSINMNRTAYAVGGAKYSDCAKTGGGKEYGKIKNANSVSVELCDNVKKDPSAAQIAAVRELIKYIRKYCPNAKTIVRHFDVNGKYCPARMMDEKKWTKFKRAIL